MTQITDPRWGEYARLQRILQTRRIVNDLSNGFEAALDSLLWTVTSDATADAWAAQAQRANENAMRRDRRRRGLRAREESHLLDLGRAEADRPAEDFVHARLEVARIMRAATTSERAVVICLANVDDPLATLGVTPPAFRKRLQRLRERLAA